MSPDGTNLGPLPGTDDNDERERESLAALEAELPRDMFRLRSQSGRDQGMDRYIEVIADGRDTNFRAQVQAKSCASARDNADGSVSESIETSNFNYLLNGSCPIYILWIADRRELRLAWARDEYRRLSRAGVNLRTQKHVSLHFNRRVVDAAPEIRARIISEGLLHRHIQEALARQVYVEAVTLQLDAATLAVTDAGVAETRLREAGITFVAAGHGETVLSLLNVLLRVARVSPRMQLIAGYAHFARERFHLARGELAEAKLREDELNASDRSFLDRLLNASDWELGHITDTEYSARDATLVAAGGALLNNLNRLEQLRYEHLRERDHSRSESLLAEMLTVATAIDADSAAPPAARLTASAAILYNEGHQLISRYREALTRYLIPSPWDTAASPLPHLLATPGYRAWFQRLQELVHQAARKAHPLVTADATYTLASSLCAMLATLKGTSEIVGQTHPDEARVTELARQMIEGAVSGFEAVSSLRSALLARLVHADLLDVLNDTSGSRVIATDVERQARIMRYDDILDSATDLLDGRSPYRVMIEQFRAAESVSEDEFLAGTSDQALNGMVQQISTRYGLPPGRSQHIERHLHVQRRMSRERMDWCRYLEILSDITHEESPDTMYRDFPPQACHCRLFTDRLVANGQDWERSLNEFKSQHCAGCSARAPANAGSASG